jgi:hypothetical protein
MRSAEERLPDFSEERPEATVVPIPAFGFRRADWEPRARRLSALLRGFPAIQSSSVRIVCVRRVIRYLDTDTSVALHARSLWLLEAGAETQAEDGMPLRDFVSFYARSPEEAPAEDTMASAVREMGRRLTSMRSAPALDEPVSGPVLLEDQAAAEFFLALVGQSAAVARDPVQEDRRFGAAMGAGGGGSPWKGRLGSRVASDFLGAHDDPTLREFRGLSLIGSYAADDEGIPAQSVDLVEKGILRGVLSTRTPVKGAARSNGHSRTLFGSALQSSLPAPGVLVVTASNEKAVSPADVRARLLETLRDRGLESGWIIRRVQNEAANPARHDELSMWMSGMRGSRPSPMADPIEVVRVSVDGAETPVRGILWGNLDVRTLKDLLLASSGDDGEAVFNTRAAPPGFAGWQSGGALPTSVVCPRSVLIEEAELAPAAGEFPAPPVLPHPHFTKPTAGK